MDEKALVNLPMGRLVEISGYDPRFQEEYSAGAFLPNPLPEVIDFNAVTYKAIIGASTALARADEAIALLPKSKFVGETGDPTRGRQHLGT